MNQLRLKYPCLGFDWHDRNNLMAISLVNGEIELYELNEEKHNLKLNYKDHKESVRDVSFFNKNNDQLISISSDKSILLKNIETNQNIQHIQNAHKNGINVLKVDFKRDRNENLFATGDDQGIIKIWDVRMNNNILNEPSLIIKEQNDYISDMFIDQQKHLLYATSGDGTLSAIDLRWKKDIINDNNNNNNNKKKKNKKKRKRDEMNNNNNNNNNNNKFKRKGLIGHSEDRENDLLSVTSIKHGNKILCSSSSGAIEIWTKNQWADCSDRYLPPKDKRRKNIPINCLLKIDEEKIITGSEDGSIHLVSILPNQEIMQIGLQEHIIKEDEKDMIDQEFTNLLNEIGYNLSDIDSDDSDSDSDLIDDIDDDEIINNNNNNDLLKLNNNNDNKIDSDNNSDSDDFDSDDFDSDDFNSSLDDIDDTQQLNNNNNNNNNIEKYYVEEGYENIVENFSDPVEGLVLSPDKNILASLSQEGYIFFWDVSNITKSLHNIKINKNNNNNNNNIQRKKKKKKVNARSFFSDL